MNTTSKQTELAINLMQIAQLLGGGEIRLAVQPDDFEALAGKLLPLSRLAVRLSKRANLKAQQIRNADQAEVVKLREVVNEQAELLKLRKIECQALRNLNGGLLSLTPQISAGKAMHAPKPTLTLSPRLSPRRRQNADLLFDWIVCHHGARVFAKKDRTTFCSTFHLHQHDLDLAIDDLFNIGAVNVEIVGARDQRVTIPDPDNLTVDNLIRRQAAMNENRVFHKAVEIEETAARRGQ